VEYFFELDSRYNVNKNSLIKINGDGAFTHPVDKMSLLLINPQIFEKYMSGKSGE
jgi:hypothetical protein